jgi:hypothetical protein
MPFLSSWKISAFTKYVEPSVIFAKGASLKLFLIFKLDFSLGFGTLLTDSIFSFKAINVTIRKKLLVILFIIDLNSFFKKEIIESIVNINSCIISVILDNVKISVVSVSKSNRNGRDGASVLLTKNELVLNSDCYNNRNIPFIHYFNFRLF